MNDQITRITSENERGVGIVGVLFESGNVGGAVVVGAIGSVKIPPYVGD